MNNLILNITLMIDNLFKLSIDILNFQPIGNIRIIHWIMFYFLYKMIVNLMKSKFKF
jgi:hypothetical protein